jgi:hypothetical protein
MMAALLIVLVRRSANPSVWSRFMRSDEAFAPLSLSLSLSLSVHCFVVDASIDAAVGRTLGRARISKAPAMQRRRRLFPDRQCPEMTCHCFVALNKRFFSMRLAGEK